MRHALTGQCGTATSWSRRSCGGCGTRLEAYASVETACSGECSCGRGKGRSALALCLRVRRRRVDDTLTEPVYSRRPRLVNDGLKDAAMYDRHLDTPSDQEMPVTRTHDACEHV